MNRIVLIAALALAACGGGIDPNDPNAELPESAQAAANKSGGAVAGDVYTYAPSYRNWNASGTATRDGANVRTDLVFTATWTGENFVSFIDHWRFRPVGRGTMNAVCSDSEEGTVPCTVTAWPDGVVYLDQVFGALKPHAAKTGMIVTISGAVYRGMDVQLTE